MVDGDRWTGESSAAFALPARHASSTADVYVFTVGFFYRGLQQHKEATVRNTARTTDSTGESSVSAIQQKAVTVTGGARRPPHPPRVSTWKLLLLSFRWPVTHISWQHLLKRLKPSLPNSSERVCHGNTQYLASLSQAWQHMLVIPEDRK